MECLISGFAVVGVMLSIGAFFALDHHGRKRHEEFMAYLDGTDEGK